MSSKAGLTEFMSRASSNDDIHRASQDQNPAENPCNLQCEISADSPSLENDLINTINEWAHLQLGMKSIHHHNRLLTLFTSRIDSDKHTLTFLDVMTQCYVQCFPCN